MAIIFGSVITRDYSILISLMFSLGPVYHILLGLFIVKHLVKISSYNDTYSHPPVVYSFFCLNIL
jgi:hypothetical protein